MFINSEKITYCDNDFSLMQNSTEFNAIGHWSTNYSLSSGIDRCLRNLRLLEIKQCKKSKFSTHFQIIKGLVCVHTLKHNTFSTPKFCALFEFEVFTLNKNHLEIKNTISGVKNDHFLCNRYLSTGYGKKRK